MYKQELRKKLECESAFAAQHNQTNGYRYD